MCQGGTRDRSQRAVRSCARRPADDLPEHRRARFRRRAAGARGRASAAIRDGRTQYTQATGLPALREQIADWYATPLRHAHRAAAHRRDGGRLGGTAAARGRAVRGWRRCADARPVLSRATATSSPPRTLSAVLLATDERTRFQLDARAVADAWGATHARRAAGIAVEPDRHLDRSRRNGAHRRGHARA